MAERDPFGRLIGEDSLEGLGSLSDETESRSQAGKLPAEPEGSDDRAAGQGSAAQLPKRSARRAVVIAILVIAALSLGASLVGALLVDTADESSQPASATPSSAEPASPTRIGDRPAPVGLQPRSMLLASNFAPAMRRLRGSGLGRLRSLRVAPERIDAQLVTGSGRLRFVQLPYDGQLRRLSLSGTGFGSLPTIAFARVNASAPARIVRSAARRSKSPASRIDYIVLSPETTAAWSVFMRGGAHFAADARGTIMRRIG